MHKERINPPGTAFPGMSQAIRCGGWLTVSGQVSLVEGQVVGVGDPLAQARQCFSNLCNVLRSAEARLDQVVMLRGYLTHREAYDGYAQVKSELFGDIAPAGTVVIVADLLLDGLLMELEAVAWLGEES